MLIVALETKRDQQPPDEHSPQSPPPQLPPSRTRVRKRPVGCGPGALRILPLWKPRSVASRLEPIRVAWIPWRKLHSGKIGRKKRLDSSVEFSGPSARTAKCDMRREKWQEKGASTSEEGSSGSIAAEKRGKTPSGRAATQPDSTRVAMTTRVREKRETTDLTDETDVYGSVRADPYAPSNPWFLSFLLGSHRSAIFSRLVRRSTTASA